MLKIKKLYPALITTASFAIPLIVAAQEITQGEEVNSRIRIVSGTLNLIITALFVLATVVFLWGVVQFIAKSGDEAARTKSKGLMMWGIIGLAVMAAAWGVARILVNYFGTGGGGPGFVEPPRSLFRTTP